MAEEKPTPALPVFKLSDIADHNTEKNIWISIGGKVYNLTDYVNDHPGGVEIMMQHAGQEATEAFKDIGHSKSAHKTLEKYLVGSLDEADVAATAGKRSGVTGGAEHGGSMTYYAGGAIALAVALWYHFGSQ